MIFKGNFAEFGYLKNESCFFLNSYMSNGSPLWNHRLCKEEFGYNAKYHKNSQFLFFGKHDLDKLVEKFNEYAEKIGLVSRAEMGILEDRCDKTYPVAVVNDTLNPLEREAAAILIKTLYLNRDFLLFGLVNIKNLFLSDPYFCKKQSLCDVFSNWK